MDYLILIFEIEKARLYNLYRRNDTDSKETGRQIMTVNIEETKENLTGAGLDGEMTDYYIKLREDGKKMESRRFLEKYRKTLLDGIHDNQKKLDLLDYYLYVLRKNEF